MAAWREHRREQQRASPPIPRRRSRLAQQRVRHSLLCASATESQRAGRLAAFLLRQRQRTAAESAEDGRSRLAALRIRQRLRVAVESAEDRKLAVVPLAHKRAPASATQLAYARPTMLCIRLVVNLFVGLNYLWYGHRAEVRVTNASTEAASGYIAIYGLNSCKLCPASFLVVARMTKVL